jgi:TetR/AcrR family transcriptional regulator, tetracycline repressor protein
VYSTQVVASPKRTEPRRPGERAGLTTEAVLATARRLVREHGTDGLSMRRIAAELGVLPNTLYSHVADKQALLDALVDQLLGEIVPPPGRTWRARAIGLLKATRTALLHEPALAMQYVQRAGAGPNAIRLAQQGLQISADAGIPPDRAAEAFRVMIAYTVGFVAFELGRAGAGRPPLPARVDLDRVARAPGNAEFELGLEWLMDGVATMVEH